MKKKIIIGFLLVLLLIGCFTCYKLFYKKNNNKLVNHSNGIADSISYSIVPSKIDTVIKYSENYLNNPYVEIKIENTSDVAQMCELYINIDQVDERILSEKFSYVIVKSVDGKEFNEIGYFSGANTASGFSFSILVDNIIANSKNIYRVYLRLNEDISAELSFKGSVTVRMADNNRVKTRDNTRCTNPRNKSINYDGLIPVVIDDNGSVTTIKSTSKKWYDYCNNFWANAILVTENARSKYLNKNHVKVDTNDILAYFVYIPRYSYKIWTNDVSFIDKEDTIGIKFIDKDTKDNGTKVGEWYTHPAFTFGDAELDGIWVGKFELTGSLEMPQVLPNQNAVVNKSLGEYFKSSLLLSGGIINNNQIVYNGSNTYGLSKKVNSHLIKNSEWGAVAYLSHSRYGINDKIRINNYFNEHTFLTGCGGDNTIEEGSNICAIPYGGAKKYPQSTTGNISGIFDMSGGTGEYVMAYNGGDNNHSQLASEWFNNPSNDKYYNRYDYEIFNGNNITNIKKCTISSCGGHALNETYFWYGTVAFFSDGKYNFLKRGCGSQTGIQASQFCYGVGDGSGGGGTSSRVILSINS